MATKDWFGASILTGLLFFNAYLLITPINLSTADLGRHIKNGEQLLAGNFELLYKNYYSYTYVDFPFVNHHWLGGVVFYFLNTLGGLTLVQLLFITVNLITFAIFFYISKRYSNIYVSSIIALLILPVIAYRDEVRPEAFSYLFAGIYFLILRQFLNGAIKKKWAYLLIPIQLIWANTHIYFFVGFFILAVFWFITLLSWLRKKTGIKNLQTLTLIGLGTVLVSLINPHFIQGLIYPFQIFGNYGYKVLENQSVFFLESIIDVPAIRYFKIILFLLVISWFYKIFRLVKNKEGIDLANLIFSVAFSALAIIQVRNFALFGFFALAIITANFKMLKIEANKYLLLPALGILLIVVLVISPKYWEQRTWGFGTAEGIEKAGEFFIGENIKGPVFNNYDIGGYLIYFLYPKEKVFVDNRPEGYPAEFFNNVYVPMQENEEVWKQELAKYNFNSIFFYRQDLTPWAQRFLVSRIKDPEWAPIFVDNYNIIFVRRNEANTELIRKFELPKEMFKISQ